MEPSTASEKDPQGVLDRLLQATNRHEVTELAACFAEDYVNRTPAHPGRGFTGRDQVRRNWEQIFAGIPDITASILSATVDGGRIWSEWHLSGNRGDGTPHEMAGVIIFTIDGGEITTARFYLEPVEHGSGTVADAVRRTVTTAAAR
ncbi:MAG: nuclear transport factor 2 family protein [Actinomycetales bacterium]